MQFSFAQAPKPGTALQVEKIIYNPVKYQPGSFFVSYKDYQDIRIDSDWDGKIDLWKVKKGPLEFEVTYVDGRVRTYYAKKIINDQVQEVFYKNEKGTLKLQYANKRALERWAYDESTKPVGIFSIAEKEQKDNKDNAAGSGSVVPDVIKKALNNSLAILKGSTECPLAKKPLEELSSQADNMQTTLFLDYFKEHGLDSSCDQVLNPRTRGQVVSAVKSAIFDLKLESCLQKSDFQNAIAPTPEALVQFKKFEVQFAARNQSLRQQVDLTKGLVRCEIDKDESGKTLESTEDGHIVIHVGKNGQSDLDGNKIKHEFLHMAGLKDEALVDSVQVLCKSYTGDDGLKLVASNNQRTTFTIDIDAKQASKQVAKSEKADTHEEAIASEVAKQTSSPNAVSRQVASESTVNMKEEMSVASVAAPDSTTLSQMISNPPHSTDEGATAALTRSAFESNNALRMANNIVGTMNTPSVASMNTLAEADVVPSSSSEHTDTPARRTVASTNNNFSTLTKSTLKSDERVVESITLDGTSSPSRATTSQASTSTDQNVSAQTKTQSARNPASSELASSTPSTPSRGSSNARVSSSSAGSLGASASGSFAAAASTAASDRTGTSEVTPKNNIEPINTGTNNGNGNNTRAPASVANTNRQSTSTAAREESITFVSNGNYSTVKAKLKDSSFSKTLESQKITILDLYGNSYGAAKGEVIFLDQGDQFVRQK